MPGDHRRPRIGRRGHGSRVSSQPQIPMNNAKPTKNATAILNQEIRRRPLDRDSMIMGLPSYGAEASMGW